MKNILCFLFILPVFLLSAHAYSASAYAVLDADTGTLLDSGNADTRLPMASTTKIMTGLLAAEDDDPDRIITVPASCAGVEGSSMYLQAGEKLALRDVLYGLMLCSGNDAAECIAAVCGGRDAFIQRMNERAAELGLHDTHFDNPSGLDGETHYTTAAELAKLAAAALKNPLFAEVVSTQNYRSGTHSMHNHNKLLALYPDCIGVKTGFTKSSGRCLVSAAKRDGRTVVAVTLNDGDDWNDHAAMLDAAFSTLHTEVLLPQGKTVVQLPVISGKSHTVELGCSRAVTVSLFGDQQVELSYFHRGMQYAPVRAGGIYGRVTASIGSTVLDSCPLIATKTINVDESQIRLTLFEKIQNLFR